MSLPWDVVLYIIITLLIVGVGIFVSFLADQLQSKTKMSAALISGVFLGILSGVPEIVADITTVIIKHPQLAVGDIIGSNLLNVSLLAIATLIFIKNIRKFKCSRADIANLISLILMHILYVIGFFTKGIFLLNQAFSIISLIAFIIYIVNVWLMSKDKHEATQSHTSFIKIKLTLKNIIIWFVIGGLILVGLSIALVLVSNDLIEHVWGGQRDSFGASILLGIATSLSEAIAVFTLLYLKNTQAAVSHILGTNLFNVFVLALVDAVKGKASGSSELFNDDHASKAVAISALILMGLLCVWIMWRQWKIMQNHLVMRNVGSVMLLGLISFGYFGYLIYAGVAK